MRQRKYRTRGLFAFEHPLESLLGKNNNRIAIYWKDEKNGFYGGNDLYSELCGFNMDHQNNDSYVIKNNITKLFIEKITNTNNSLLYGLSLKTPLRNSSKKIVGVLGMTQIINEKLTSFPLNFDTLLSDESSYDLLRASIALHVILQKNITSREAEVLYYFIRYHSSKSVASHMENISYRTIEVHLRSCKRKLCLFTTSKLLNYLWHIGFVYLRPCVLSLIYEEKKYDRIKV